MFRNKKTQKVNAIDGDGKKATSSYGKMKRKFSVQKEEMELKFAVQMEEMKGLEVKGLRFRCTPGQGSAGALPHYVYPGTVLPGQYSSTLSSTVLLLFVHTSVETRFLYKTKAVLLQSSRAFPEVSMVQRAALRAIWKGSIGRSPHRPSLPKKMFFFFF